MSESKVLHFSLTRTQEPAVGEGEFNQEVELLQEQADQVARFMALSPKQQRTYLLSGRIDGVSTIRRMVATLYKLARSLPHSGWE